VAPQGVPATVNKVGIKSQVGPPATLSNCGDTLKLVSTNSGGKPRRGPMLTPWGGKKEARYVGNPQPSPYGLALWERFTD
jgi:hypothetical protein